jgi:hypothetical protein
MYGQRTGLIRDKGDIIAYHQGQSFRPGEIAPQEALEVGFKLAEKFTRGCNAFVCAVHTDKQHRPCHIGFCAVNLDRDRKVPKAIAADENRAGNQRLSPCRSGIVRSGKHAAVTRQ